MTLVGFVFGLLFGILAGFELCLHSVRWSIETPDRCRRCEKEHHA